MRSAYFAEPSQGTVYAEGTTVPLIGVPLTERPSGLLVPAAAVRVPAPIDLAQMFVTAEDVLGFTPPPGYVIEQLRRLPLADALTWCAQLLSWVECPDAGDKRTDAELARSLITGSASEKVQNLLQDRTRRLVIPQGVLVLAKLATLYCPKAVDAAEPANMIAALLTVSSYLSGSAGPDPETGNKGLSGLPPGLAREIVANQYFNVNRDEKGLFARFVRRFLHDDGVGGLREFYHDATGVLLDDIVVVALGLWSRAVKHEPRTGPGWFDSLGWDTDRLDAALALIATPENDLRAQIVDDVENFGMDWHFYAFGRHPVVRLSDDSLVLMSPRLLLERVFGWLPIFDVEDGFKKQGQSKKAARAMTRFRSATEKYALETLASIVGNNPTVRLFDEDALKAAYGAPGVRIADVAIDYGDAMVVIEVNSGRLKTPTVAALSDDALREDVGKLVINKAEQVDSTIRQIRADEARLTGSAAVRRFYPVVVVAEGFPTNPITTEMVADELGAAGYLRDADVAPLQVLDLEDLEIIEALQEHGGPSLRDLLDSKPNGGLARMDMKSFILAELRLRPEQAQRVQALWPEVFKPAETALGATA